MHLSPSSKILQILLLHILSNTWYLTFFQHFLLSGQSHSTSLNSALVIQKPQYHIDLQLYFDTPSPPCHVRPAVLAAWVEAGSIASFSHIPHPIFPMLPFQSQSREEEQRRQKSPYLMTPNQILQFPVLLRTRMKKMVGEKQRQVKGQGAGEQIQLQPFIRC